MVDEKRLEIKTVQNIQHKIKPIEIKKAAQI